MIHPLAHYDGSGIVGSGTKVWQFASIVRGAHIGKNCTIGSGAVVDGAIVGDECLVGAGAQLHPGTRVGNLVFVGPGAIFTNDVWPSVDKDGFETPSGSKFTVIVEDGASIGAGAIILPGVRIGAGALVAAGAIVARDIAAGVVCYRNDWKALQRPENWRQRRMRYVA